MSYSSIQLKAIKEQRNNKKNMNNDTYIIQTYKEHTTISATKVKTIGIVTLFAPIVCLFVKAIVLLM